MKRAICTICLMLLVMCFVSTKAEANHRKSSYVKIVRMRMARMRDIRMGKPRVRTARTRNPDNKRLKRNEERKRILDSKIAEMQKRLHPVRYANSPRGIKEKARAVAQERNKTVATGVSKGGQIYSVGFAEAWKWIAGGSRVHVKSYTRKDGTRVKAHTRRYPR